MTSTEPAIYNPVIYKWPQKDGTEAEVTLTLKDGKVCYQVSRGLRVLYNDNLWCLFEEFMQADGDTPTKVGLWDLRPPTSLALPSPKEGYKCGNRYFIDYRPALPIYTAFPIHLLSEADGYYRQIVAGVESKRLKHIQKLHMKALELLRWRPTIGNFDRADIRDMSQSAALPGQQYPTRLTLKFKDREYYILYKHTELGSFLTVHIGRYTYCANTLRQLQARVDRLCTSPVEVAGWDFTDNEGLFNLPRIYTQQGPVLWYDDKPHCITNIAVLPPGMLGEAMQVWKQLSTQLDQDLLPVFEEAIWDCRMWLRRNANG